MWAKAGSPGFTKKKKTVEIFTERKGNKTRIV